MNVEKNVIRAKRYIYMSPWVITVSVCKELSKESIYNE